MLSKTIFSLDIGTRSVTGILINQSKESFSILDYYTIEHKERSMRDGQIHDVIAVAEVIKEVKKKLEERNAISLKEVSVAAAGRTLKTIEASASVDLLEYPLKTAQDIKHLELSALKVAQEKLASEQEKDKYSNYYCVGYSLLYYKLDDEIIGSLIEQQGQVASVEIIATFLPKVVVESLLTALKLADLHMDAMTLEPIAALHVLIPESMRRLNVVLVDIGAGTSDIAIANKGTVVAYGMVPIAGDEITEAISDHYLLDFPEAESVKRQIVNEGKAEIMDILGFGDEVTYNDLLTAVENDINKLASRIANEILALNTQSPRAVMLVGGGSLTPNITELIAEKLDLPGNRVAVRDVQAIANLIKDDKIPAGPDFVTPIGIAITAQERPVQYVQVNVNDASVRLFELNELTVGDALVQAGYEINRMYGKPGLAKFVKINDKEITIPGEFGKDPEIYLNGEKVEVTTNIKNGDVIQINKGVDGTPAELTLAELINSEEQKKIHYKNKEYVIGNIYFVNQAHKEPTYIVQDNDMIEWKNIETIKDFLEFYNINHTITTKFPVIINQKHLQLSVGETKILINGVQASLVEHLSHQDQLEIIPAKNPTVEDLFTFLKTNYWDAITIYFNDEKVTLKQEAYLVKRNDETLSLDSLVQMNDRIKITEKQTFPFIFQNVFRYVDIDLTNVQGTFKLYCNDEQAAFDTKIKTGDKLSILWEQNN
ncbi:cell division protein FtsA [Oceanobacillus sp. CAU 1775]